jgi:hypothetical protein
MSLTNKARREIGGPYFIAKEITFWVVVESLPL